MKAWRFRNFDSLESLVVRDEAMPEPQRGEVLIRVRSVALNYRDIAMVRGRYPQTSRGGFIPASDAAGDVVATGAGVRGLATGQRVISTFHPRWFGGPIPPDMAAESYGSEQDGWLVEYKVVNQEAVIPIGDALSYEEAATLPCAGLTAWTALAGPAPIRAGDRVLTLGTGGVSIFAIQIAHMVGAQVIATTSNADKARRLSEMGVSQVVNYLDRPLWGDHVRTLTGGGVDRVVEVGGAGTFGQSLKACRLGGEIVVIGFLSEDEPSLSYMDIKRSGAVIRPIFVGDRSALQQLLRAYEGSNVRPIIDRVFGYQDARAAFEHLANGKQFGKVVIRLS